MSWHHMTGNAPCIVCGSQATTQILDAIQVPVLCNVLWTTREAAVAVPRAEMRLLFCPNCGHLFNAAFDPAALEYTESYENSLDFSPVFQGYANSLASELVERFQLHHKRIVEIGSGKGDFLRLLCELGDNQGTGFDPSYAPDDESEPADRRVEFVQDLYGDAYAHFEADFICCRHTLEHLPQPAKLVRTVHQAADQNGAAVFFEVPNALYTLRDLGIWDLIYEHCSYFTGCSLAHVFRESGFRVGAVTEAYGDQFLCIDAFPQAGMDTHEPYGCAEQEELNVLAASFSSRYRDKMAVYKRQLQTNRAAGKRTVLWGAGSKGVTFLNLLHDVTDHDVGGIECVVDINPRKQGMFVSGTGQPIVAPEHLSQIRPDVVIVMNSIYKQEIVRTLTDLGVDAEIVLA